MRLHLLNILLRHCQLRQRPLELSLCDFLGHLRFACDKDRRREWTYAVRSIIVHVYAFSFTTQYTKSSLQNVHDEQYDTSSSAAFASCACHTFLFASAFASFSPDCSCRMRSLQDSSA